MAQPFAQYLPLLRNQFIKNIHWRFSAKYSSPATQEAKSSKPQSENEWQPIYKLPVINWAAALCKIKVYQAGFTAVAIPACYAVETASIAPQGSTVALSVLGISGTITLLIASYFTQNLIGLIYVDSDKHRVRLSYVDFWGKRKNVELRHDELEPPAEKLQFGVIAPVKTTRGTYKLLRRMGQVRDPNVFAHYFGE